MSKVKTPMAVNTKKARMMAMAEAQYITLTGDMADRQAGRVMSIPNAASSVNYRKKYHKYQAIHQPWQYGWFERECARRGVS